MMRVIVVVILGSALCAGVAYQFNLFQWNTSSTGNKMDKKQTLDEFGPDLYDPRQVDPTIEPPIGVRGKEPILVSGQLTLYDRADVSSLVEGKVQFIGEEIPIEAQLLGGVASFLPDPCYVLRDRHEIVRSSSKTFSKEESILVYRRLFRGDIVEKGQMVACLEKAKASTEKQIKFAELLMSDADYESAKQKAETYKYMWDKSEEQNARRPGTVALMDVLIQKATYLTAKYEADSKQQAIQKARNNLEQAQLYLKWHGILNQVATPTAVIKEISKEPSDTIKQGDKLLELQSQEKFVAEGRLEIQYLGRVRPKMRASIEPSQEEAPLGRPSRFHNKEVTSVAFTNRGLPRSEHPDDSLIVSGSEDHQIFLWDRRSSAPLDKPQFRFKDPVRVVACSPQGCGHNLILAGCGDGSIHIIDLDSPGLKTPRKILAEQQPHGEAVTSLAFSPDGKYFASGSENASIKMWNLEVILKNHAIRQVVERIKEKKEWTPTAELQRCQELLGYSANLQEALKSGSLDKAVEELDRMHKELDGNELLYPFDAEHGAANPHYGPVTSLTFTPQCRLVSAARDNTIRVWALKKKGVVPVGFPIPGRKGDVFQLGVSHDGNFMLFDLGKTLQIMSVEDGRTINTLQTPGNTVDFQTTAIFSPDGSLLLTAGAADGGLQLWSTPSGPGRGFEVRQFIAKERSPVTCAAFAPQGSFWQRRRAHLDPKNHGALAVSGTKDGFVYVWPIPSAEEVLNYPIRDLTVTSVTPYIDQSTRHIQLTVDVRNQFSPEYPPQGRLIPGKSVTIVIRND